MLTNARRRAREAGIPFRLKLADVPWPADNKCPALGIPLETGPNGGHDASPTIDRLNPAWGYEPGNVAIISMAANRAKNSLRAKDLERVAAWMRAQGLE